MENNRNKCYYCICKTCAIAEINGGAQAVEIVKIVI